MKKFLATKYKLGLALVLFFIGSSVCVQAGTKDSYYRDYFEDLGFSMALQPFPFPDELEDFPDVMEDSSTEGFESPEEFLLSLDGGLGDEEGASDEDVPAVIPSEDWQLLFTSDSLRDYSLADTILICDTSYLNDKFYCSPDSVLSPYMEVLTVAEFPNDLEISVAYSSQEGNRLLVIPEQNLYVPEYREKMSEYLETFIESVEFKHSYSVSSSLKLPAASVDFLKSWGVETFLYAVSFLVFVLLFRKSLIRLVHSPRDFLDPKTYKEAVTRFVAIFRAVQPLLFLGLVFTGAFFIPLTVFVTVSYTGAYDLGAFLRFFDVIFSFSALSAALQNASKIVLFYYGYLGLLAFLVLLYVLPAFYDLFTLSMERLFPKERVPADLSFYKGTLLFLVSLGLFLSLVGSFPSMIPFLVTLLVLSLYLAYFLLKAAPVFSTKEKLISMLVLLVTFVAGLGISFFSGGSAPILNERYQELIGVSDSIVMLPYKKEHSEEVFFNPMPLPDFPHILFIDHWMVYHPDYPQIRVLNISEYASFRNNFVIMGMGRSAFRRAVTSYEKLRSEVLQDQLSDFIYVSDFEYSPTDRYELELAFSCEDTLSSAEIELGISYVLDSLVMEDLALLNFPGCDGAFLESALDPVSSDDTGDSSSEPLLEVSSDVFSYKIPLFFDFIPAEELVFELKNLPEGLTSLANVQLTVNGFPKEISFLKYSPERTILKENYENDGTLHVWTYGKAAVRDGKKIYRDEDAPFDLGTTATSLKQEGLVKNPFIIWSLDDAVLMRNEYIQ